MNSQSSRCIEGDRIRFRWYDSQSEADLARLRIHLKTCQKCKAEQLRMFEFSKTAVHPDFEDEE